MGRDEVLGLLREHKTTLARRFGVRDIALFGSLARDQIVDDSLREYARVESNPQLLRGGANLSAVLFALSGEFEEDEKQQAALQRITGVIRQIPEEPFTEIGFAETPLAT